MNQIQVIAKRSKKFLLLYILLFVAVAVLCIIGSTQDKDASVYFIISLVILIPTFLTFLYLLLLPTDAIIKSGDTIIIRYLFTKRFTTFPICNMLPITKKENGIIAERTVFTI